MIEEPKMCFISYTVGVIYSFFMTLICSPLPQYFIIVFICFLCLCFCLFVCLFFFLSFFHSSFFPSFLPSFLYLLIYLLFIIFIFASFHFYPSSEIRTCLQNHPVAFVGDSRTRGLYYELVEAVSLNSVKDEGKAVSL